MIETIDLTKSYGSLIAVNHLNLKVDRELFVFLGPNGAGKTTTIKMITGLLKPTSGQIKIGDFDIWQQPMEAKRLLGLVPDAPFLYEKLTGREFLQFMADIYQVDRVKARKRIDELLSLFELTGKADQLIQSYSFGMKRKCALGGALVHDPQVLFLDEPTAGLDPKSARNIKSVLSALVKRGVTVFMTTHILEIAESMCHRVGIIDHGRLIEYGTINELRAKFRKDDSSLEDIFLELTGASEEKEVLKYLD